MQHTIQAVINAQNPNGGYTHVLWKNGKFTQKQNSAEKKTLETFSSQWGLDKTDIYDGSEFLIVPTAIDGHIHSRDPGFPGKETWQSLAKAALCGGIGAVSDMPNTTPPTMTRSHILQKKEIAHDPDVLQSLTSNFYLGVGASNISEIPQLLIDQELPICGVKIYYGQSTGELMYDDLHQLGNALNQARSENPDLFEQRLLAFHSEDQCCIDKHQKAFQKEWDEANSAKDFALHSKVRNSEAAFLSTKAIINWAEKFKFSIHIAHISTPEEVDLILEARQRGAKITCEVAFHHLLFTTDDYERLGGLVKVNPPIRDAASVQKLRDHFKKGHIDCFASDHAPHTLNEKLNPLNKCPSGIPSTEIFWPLAVMIKDILQLEWTEVLSASCTRPAQLFSFPNLGKIEQGYDASFVLLSKKPWHFSKSMAHCGWSPYQGWIFPAKVAQTWIKGKQLYA